MSSTGTPAPRAGQIYRNKPTRDPLLVVDAPSGFGLEVRLNGGFGLPSANVNWSDCELIYDPNLPDTEQLTAELMGEAFSGIDDNKGFDWHDGDYAVFQGGDKARVESELAANLKSLLDKCDTASKPSDLQQPEASDGACADQIEALEDAIKSANKRLSKYEALHGEDRRRLDEVDKLIAGHAKRLSSLEDSAKPQQPAEPDAPWAGKIPEGWKRVMEGVVQP